MTNVLLIVLDSVRARNTSLHNYKRQTTPFLDRFSERAIRYTQARAPGVGSIQSHTSIFTGLYPEQHQLRDPNKSLEPGHTIWEELAQRDYDTGVFSYNSYLTQAPIGLKEVFDVVESGDEQRLLFPEAYDPNDLESDGLYRYIEFLQAIINNNMHIKTLANGISHWEWFQPILPKCFQAISTVPDSLFTNSFLQWQKDSSGPWAACVNYMGAHTPYFPDKDHNKWAGKYEREIMNSVENHAWSFITGEREWSERAALENLYDGCIHQVDSEVERLISELETRGVLEDTFVVITSDHGEGFGEQSPVRPVRSVAHGNTGGPGEGILHVPLVVFLPEKAEEGNVDKVASLVQFPNAVRTVLEGTETEQLFVPNENNVLASMFDFTSADKERLPHFVTGDDYAEYNYGSRVVYETTNDGRIVKYIKVKGDNVYCLDCTNVHDTVELDRTRENIVERNFNQLESTDVLTRSKRKISGEVRNRLEQLGYR